MPATPTESCFALAPDPQAPGPSFPAHCTHCPPGGLRVGLGCRSLHIGHKSPTETAGGLGAVPPCTSFWVGASSMGSQGLCAFMHCRPFWAAPVLPRCQLSTPAGPSSVGSFPLVPCHGPAGWTEVLDRDGGQAGRGSAGRPPELCPPGGAALSQHQAPLEGAQSPLCPRARSARPWPWSSRLSYDEQTLVLGGG